MAVNFPVKFQPFTLGNVNRNSQGTLLIEGNSFSSKSYREIPPPVWIFLNVFWSILVMKQTGNNHCSNSFYGHLWIRVLTWEVKMVRFCPGSVMKICDPGPFTRPCQTAVSQPYEPHHPNLKTCHLTPPAGQAGPEGCSRVTWEMPLEWKEGTGFHLTMVKENDFATVDSRK